MLRALTGAAAAAHLGLDGFRETAWPPLLCSPASGSAGRNVVRTRQWREPIWIDDVLIAHPALVLRHLGWQFDELRARRDLPPEYRIELALEHLLREGRVRLNDLLIRGSSSSGDVLLRTLLSFRGNQPPTESYAETRAAQRFREWGFTVWRQVEVVEPGRRRLRADFAVAFRANARRPETVRPRDAVLVELDSREFHAETFDRDHDKQLAYQVLGFSRLVITPNQLEHSPGRVRMAIERALASRPRG